MTALDDGLDYLREKVGVGRCPICGERSDPEHSGLAVGGQIWAGCRNGHRWLVEMR